MTRVEELTGYSLTLTERTLLNHIEELAEKGQSINVDKLKPDSTLWPTLGNLHRKLRIDIQLIPKEGDEVEVD